MLFGSCDERIESEGNIGFTADVASFNGGYVGTKGEPIGDPLLDPDTYVPSFQTKHGANGFKVSAYKGATAKFTDAVSKYTNGAWTLTPGAKWYSGETLDFYAITQDRGISNQIRIQGRAVLLCHMGPTELQAAQNPRTGGKTSSRSES